MKFIFRVLKVLIPIAATAPLLTGCSSDGFALGGKYLDSSIRTAIVDTCTIKLTTVPIDSVPTSGQKMGLVGRYADPYWGTVTAETYISYLPPKAQNFEHDVTFDSIGLVMTLKGTYTGDTLRNHAINIYKLDESIELPTYVNFYNVDKIPYTSSPLVTYSIIPRPFTPSGSSMNPLRKSENNHFFIRLPDEIGTDLFEKIQNDDPVLDNNEKFRSWFKGFALAPGENNSAVLGFKITPEYELANQDAADSLCAMRIYYHYSTYQRERGYIDMFVDEDRYFYNVSHDRSGTDFANLDNERKGLSTSLTDNIGLVQALTATYVKVEFPYLNNIQEMGDYATIIDAVLLLYPVKDSYSDSVPLPKSLSIYVSDENDVSVSALRTYSGESLQNGSLVEDKLYDKDTYYTYDVTSFLQDQLGAFGIYKRNLQIIAPEDSMSVSLNTLTFGDQKYAKDRTRLIVKYLIYGNE